MSHSEITLREITRMVSGAAHSHEIIGPAQIRDCLEIIHCGETLAISHSRFCARTHEIARDVTSLWLVVDTATD